MLEDYIRIVDKGMLEKISKKLATDRNYFYETKDIVGNELCKQCDACYEAEILEGGEDSPTYYLLLCLDRDKNIIEAYYAK
jgi:hypothetical protein